MKTKHLSLLILFFLLSCSNAGAQKLSCDELADVLDVRSWRVPMPKDERFEWSIEVVDYAQQKPVRLNGAKFSTRQKALIALRGTGKNSYEFTLKNRAGTSQGDLEIDLCSEIEKKENRCDNSYSITWHNPAEPYGDGTKFLIADIIGERSRKQIVLSWLNLGSKTFWKTALCSIAAGQQRLAADAAIAFSHDASCDPACESSRRAAEAKRYANSPMTFIR